MTMRRDRSAHLTEDSHINDRVSAAAAGGSDSAARAYRRRLQADDPHTALPLLLLDVSRLTQGNAHVAQEEDRCDSTTGSTSTTAGSICT